MAPSPFFHTEAPERLSESPPPFILEGSSSTDIPANWANSSQWRNLVAKMPPQLRAMLGYLVAGVVLGLALIVGISFMLGEPAPKKAAAAPVTVNDDVVRLHAHEIPEKCWRGSTNTSLAKLSVAIEVGLDGKVRSANANGDSPVMRGCVETHVKGWEFLPQASSSQMVLPFEVDPR